MIKNLFEIGRNVKTVTICQNLVQILIYFYSGLHLKKLAFPDLTSIPKFKAASETAVPTHDIHKLSCISIVLNRLIPVLMETQGVLQL